MRLLEADLIAGVVKRLCIEANRNLPSPVKDCIRQARKNETWPPAQDTLDKIIENFEIASRRKVPICQDTGMACVFLEIGQDIHIEGDLYAAVNEGVRQGYREGRLRNSVVGDPLERKNTGDNTPAMIYTEYTRGDKVTVTVAPKGFGSENMSRLRMLKPSDGVDGVIDFVVSVVEEAGPNPCPPVVVGVGIGGAFDKAALLAKKALLRPPGIRNKQEYYAKLETTILEKINSLGIGPQGFGGAVTALSVAIETLPTHIAGLPCAVNINCHVSRHATEVL
ncbi:MAG: fumarate hydratase [Treponema sp.]|jgi:fumarate hydratase subunit alpha|nr:fumarate hydratase [Treponema sp.]